jgi:hypothetical protein
MGNISYFPQRFWPYPEMVASFETKIYWKQMSRLAIILDNIKLPEDLIRGLKLALASYNWRVMAYDQLC